MIRRYGIAALVALVAIAPSLAAQYTASECSAITANALAHPARRDSLAAAGMCPQWSSTFATLIGRYSLASDTATYGFIFDFISGVRNPDIFAAAKVVAGDGSAPEFARVGSLLLLTNFSSTVGVRIARRPLLEVSSLTNYDSMLPVLTQGVRDDPGASMPADYVAQSLMLSRTVMSDTLASVPVRAAAYCLHTETLGDSLPNPPETPYNFTPATEFELVARCGSNFLIRNHTIFPITIEAVPTTGSGEKWMNLPPRSAGTSYSEMSLHWTFADINIKYGGMSIAHATTNTTACATPGSLMFSSSRAPDSTRRGRNHAWTVAIGAGIGGLLGGFAADRVYRHDAADNSRRAETDILVGLASAALVGIVVYALTRSQH